MTESGRSADSPETGGDERVQTDAPTVDLTGEPSTGGPESAPAGVAAGAGDGAGEPGPSFPSDSVPDAFEQDAERYVGAAFAGGLVLAQLLKRLGSG